MVGTVAGVGVAAYADGDSQPTTSGDTSTTQTQTTETPATDGASGNKTGESGESEADTKSDSTGADADTAQSGDAVAKQAAPAPASVDAVAARKALPSILGNVPSTNGSIRSTCSITTPTAGTATSITRPAVIGSCVRSRLALLIRWPVVV